MTFFPIFTLVPCLPKFGKHMVLENHWAVERIWAEQSWISVQSRSSLTVTHEGYTCIHRRLPFYIIDVLWWSWVPCFLLVFYINNNITELNVNNTFANRESFLFSTKLRTSIILLTIFKAHIILFEPGHAKQILSFAPY